MWCSCSLLITDFATSTQPNYRKGGLHGLAAIASAQTLVAQTGGTGQVQPISGGAGGTDWWHRLEQVFKKLVPPVLVCFSDPDSRVRYYACESLYNIAKVARVHIMPYFADIFSAMCQL